MPLDAPTRGGRRATSEHAAREGARCRGPRRPRAVRSRRDRAARVGLQSRRPRRASPRSRCSAPARTPTSHTSIAAAVGSASTTELVVTVPSGATSGPIAVTAPGGYTAADVSRRSAEAFGALQRRIAGRRAPRALARAGSRAKCGAGNPGVAPGAPPGRASLVEDAEQPEDDDQAERHAEEPEQQRHHAVPLSVSRAGTVDRGESKADAGRGGDSRVVRAPRSWSRQRHSLSSSPYRCCP